MSRASDLIQKIKDSDAYLELKQRYEDLDAQTKVYIGFGTAGGLLILLICTVVFPISKLNSIKAEINDKEATIAYLQKSSDQIKQLKLQQQQAGQGADLSSPLPLFIQSIVSASGADPEKLDIGGERVGTVDKDSQEVMVDVRMNQTNLRMVNKILFNITDRGSVRGLNIKDLNMDTKGDPNGYMDASFTVASFKAK